MNYPTVEQIRAEMEVAREIAMRNFERDWGTRDVRQVVAALRQTIPSSANPADAARKARALI